MYKFKTLNLAIIGYPLFLTKFDLMSDHKARVHKYKKIKYHTYNNHHHNKVKLQNNNKSDNLLRNFKKYISKPKDQRNQMEIIKYLELNDSETITSRDL